MKRTLISYLFRFLPICFKALVFSCIFSLCWGKSGIFQPTQLDQHEHYILARACKIHSWLLQSSTEEVTVQYLNLLQDFCPFDVVPSSVAEKRNVAGLFLVTKLIDHRTDYNALQISVGIFVNTSQIRSEQAKNDE